MKNVLFLKSDKIGDGELGEKILAGFLSNLKDTPNFPKIIICVNDSVLINTNESHISHVAMKELSNLGVEIINCRTCLEYFGKIDELKIGKIGNAKEILENLCESAKVISL